MSFAVERTRRGDGVCVAVAGEVDVDSAPAFRRELLDAVRTSPLVAVDLAAVTFMDSQGLAALLGARAAAEKRGGSLVLEEVPSRVLKLLRITGLESVFAIDSTSAGF